MVAYHFSHLKPKHSQKLQAYSNNDPNETDLRIDSDPKQTIYPKCNSARHCLYHNTIEPSEMKPVRQHSLANRFNSTIAIAIVEVAVVGRPFNYLHNSTKICLPSD